MNDTKDITSLPTFNDLVFQPHANVPDAVMAKMTFGHNDQFEISVVAMNKAGRQFGGLYGSVEDNQYEVALFHFDKMLPLSVSDDVLGWQSPVDITKLISTAILNDFAWVTLLYSLRNDHRKELGLDD